MITTHDPFLFLSKFAATLGFIVERVPRSILVRPEGVTTDVAATFDGVMVRVCDALTPDVALFLAAHTLGHCQQWAACPASRLLNPADPALNLTVTQRVALALCQEQDANEYATAFLHGAMPALSAANLSRIEALAAQDWTSFATFLGAQNVPRIQFHRAPRKLLPAGPVVDLAAAFDLS